MQTKMILIFDQKRMRPGCVLIQAAMGGTVPSHLFDKHFPSEFWEVNPSPDMKAYTVTKEQLPDIQRLMENHKKSK